MHTRTSLIITQAPITATCQSTDVSQIQAVPVNIKNIQWLPYLCPKCDAWFDVFEILGRSNDMLAKELLEAFHIKGMYWIYHTSVYLFMQ